MRTFLVDSFTPEAFRGNPAGVCLAEGELAPERMLAIARELGLSETAFVRGPEARDGARRGIRFFSPKMEIPLCGHATLASARVLFREQGLAEAVFVNVQGVELATRASAEAIEMALPVYGTVPAEAPEALQRALGLAALRNVEFNAETKILLLEIESAEVLAGLAPDFAVLERSHAGINGVLVTARAPAAEGDGPDFHSRYFWPWSGTHEDPATGGTHTFLAPYWSKRLGKAKLRSFQASARTGSMEVELTSSAVMIRAQAVVVLEGRLLV